MTGVVKEKKSIHTEKGAFENCAYHQNGLQKREILEQLRRMGCRITKQREMLIDIIMADECVCCKEIYYVAVKRMPDIGMATIYRMINTLEEIGAIKRENAYRVCHQKGQEAEECVVELENDRQIELTSESLQQVIEQGMKACGYLSSEKIKNIRVKCM